MGVSSADLYFLVKSLRGAGGGINMVVPQQIQHVDRFARDRARDHGCECVIALTVWLVILCGYECNNTFG